MINHRVFLAINLPEDIKKKFLEIREKWEELPVRWTKRDSLHMTLVFLGYVNSENLYKICEITREVAKQHQPFFLNFKKIILAPPGKFPPRMIWAEGEKSSEATKLKQDIEKAFSSDGSIKFEADSRIFSPHITLARVKMMNWRNLSNPPKIDESVSMNFSVSSIEVMESHLLRDGAEYAVLESAVLGE